MPVQEGTARSAGFVVINLSPDVCKSPTVPVPYNIIAFLKHTFRASNAQGNEVKATNVLCVQYAISRLLLLRR